MAALTGATVLAWSRGDFSSTTQTYTSATVPSNGSYGSASTTATAGQYLTDSETVTVTGIDYLPASQYQFALYAGPPGESCSALTGGLLPPGYVFESGVISEPNTSQDHDGYLNNSQNGRQSFSATVNSSQAPSNGYYQVPTNASGSYFWIARYYDQPDQITVFSPCEPLTVSSPPPPAIPTSVTTNASAGGYAPTTSVSDLATVSPQSGTGVPAGNVTFNLYGPSASPICSGDLVFGPRTVALGEAGTATSPAFVPTAVGTYYWTANYSPGPGSGFAPSASECGASDESVTVTAPPPPLTATSLTTNASAGGYAPTTSVSDLATVSPQSGTRVPAGNVTFTLYGPSASPMCVGDLVFGPKTVPLGEAGTATSPAFVPTAVGTYYWTASYSPGAGSGFAPSASECGASGETVTITAIPPGPPPQTPNTPAVTTIPSAGGPVGTALSDMARVTGIVNPAGADMVSFGLYSDALCSTLVDNLGSGSLLALGPVNGVPTWTASSPGLGYAPAVAATYYWGVTFNSVGDSANLTSSLVCGEPVTIVPASGTEGAHTAPPSPAAAVKAASTPTPNTGADLVVPGLLAAVWLLLGGGLLLTGLRIRRHPSI